MTRSAPDRTLLLRRLIEQLLHALNAYDVDRALALFASAAEIDDESVGDTFKGTAQVREYIKQYFVAYDTITTLVAVEDSETRRAIAHVDFKGDFGHETGVLDITVNADGLIAKVTASLD
jgi:ketosteroid isomerase-like protein